MSPAAPANRQLLASTAGTSHLLIGRRPILPRLRAGGQDADSSLQSRGATTGTPMPIRLARSAAATLLIVALGGLGAPAAADAAPRQPLGHAGRWITDAAGRV